PLWHKVTHGFVLRNLTYIKVMAAAGGAATDNVVVLERAIGPDHRASHRRRQSTRHRSGGDLIPCLWSPDGHSAEAVGGGSLVPSRAVGAMGAQWAVPASSTGRPMPELDQNASLRDLDDVARPL